MSFPQSMFVLIQGTDTTSSELVRVYRACMYHNYDI